MNEKTGSLFSDLIDMMKLRYGGEVEKYPHPCPMDHEEVMLTRLVGAKPFHPCPLDTSTARIIWDLWQLYERGAPFKELEDVVYIFCTLYNVPVAPAHSFVFGEASIYGTLERTA
ncbi:MAG: hypothetical protein AB1384_12585 [Actinomycetota bacterium]